MSGKERLKLLSDMYKQGSASATRQPTDPQPLLSPMGRSKYAQAFQNQSNRFRKHKPGDPFQYVFSNVHMLMGHAGASMQNNIHRQLYQPNPGSSDVGFNQETLSEIKQRLTERKLLKERQQRQVLQKRLEDELQKVKAAVTMYREQLNKN